MRIKRKLARQSASLPLIEPTLFKNVNPKYDLVEKRDLSMKDQVIEEVDHDDSESVNWENFQLFLVE